MNILALETSSPVLSVSIKKGASPLKEKKLKGFLKHAENLLPVMDSLLKEQGLGLENIDAILIGRGPGSFTGLRVGFATVKGLLAVHKKACYGGLSLDMIAENVRQKKSRELAVCMDAHRQMIYARFYTSQKNGWQPSEEPKILAAKDIGSFLKDEMTVTGNALERYPEIFRSVSSKIICAPENQWFPKASSLINWFRSDSKTTPAKLQLLSKPEDFIPLYFRLSEAEERIGQHAASS